MSQADIMDFLDDHKGMKYNSEQLVELFKDSMSRVAVYRALKKIIKREEYSAIIKIVFTKVHRTIGEQVVLYWRN